MIHYHGMPVSGSREESVSFLTGRHAFVSFAAPDWVDVVADTASSFAFDNGAFSTWKRGATFDIDGYLSWVMTWHRHPGFDWAVIPDVIDGDEKANDRLLASWPLPVEMGVPVWHLHESLDRLHRLVGEYPRVALGSSGQWPTPGKLSWWERMYKVMRAACNDQGVPRTKLHGLRMLDPDIFTRLPLSSADSTNAAVNAGSLRRFGAYLAPSAGIRATVIASRIEALNSPAVWDQRQYQFTLATHCGDSTLGVYNGEVAS